MKALILAAGVGRRLGGGDVAHKSLLRFGGRSLLARHLGILAGAGVPEVVVAVGHGADEVRAGIRDAPPGVRVRTVFNPDYRRGSVVTVWSLRDEMRGGPVLLMDADVLYDHRLVDRLLGSAHPSCLLMDRDLEPGEEPVKLCLRGGRPVEFRKRIDPTARYDVCGESVGFFRLSGDTSRRLAARAGEYVRDGRLDEPYEEAIRDLLLAGGDGFGVEDVTGLPWIEIDCPADAERAAREVLPRLRAPAAAPAGPAPAASGSP